MANSKNMTFPNTTEGFRQWDRTFPPMSPEDVKAIGFKKHGDYYLQLQLVEGFLSPGKFVSAHVRKYDHGERDFNNIPNEEERHLIDTVFSHHVKAFETKHEARYYK
jgi:hypothetical protein